MENEQIQVKIQVAKTMIGECAAKIDPFAPASDLKNQILMEMADKYQAEVDALKYTLAVRLEAKKYHHRFA